MARKELAYLRTDRSRLFIPEADRIVAEEIFTHVFDTQTGRAIPEKFREVFTEIQVDQEPLSRFEHYDIDDTIVFMGSARIKSAEDAAAAKARAEAAEAKAKADAAKKAEREAARAVRLAQWAPALQRDSSGDDPASAGGVGVARLKSTVSSSRGADCDWRGICGGERRGRSRAAAFRIFVFSQ